MSVRPPECLRTPLSLALALFAVLLSAGAGGAGTASAATASTGIFGVCSGDVLNQPPAARDAQLRTMVAGGLTMVRQDAPWSAVEPAAPDPVTGAHSYGWAALDAVAAPLAAAGLRWYPILDYSTGWASSIPGDLFSAPDAAGFAAYARAFARRYGPGGTFWAEHPELPALPVPAYEIWNEENSHTFWDQQATAPESYADLYAAARAAIRQVDTATPVVVGGLLDANATDPNLFLRRMVAHRPGLRRQIDAVGYHPYQESYGGILAGTQRLRATLRRLGMARTPMELTEIGISTAWMPDPQRAQVIARLARTLPASGLGITRFIPYAWSTPVTELGDWSLAGEDGTLHKTGVAYLAAATAAPTALRARARARARAAALTRARTDGRVIIRTSLRR